MAVGTGLGRPTVSAPYAARQIGTGAAAGENDPSPTIERKWIRSSHGPSNYAPRARLVRADRALRRQHEVGEVGRDRRDAGRADAGALMPSGPGDNPAWMADVSLPEDLGGVPGDGVKDSFACLLRPPMVGWPFPGPTGAPGQGPAASPAAYRVESGRPMVRRSSPELALLDPNSKAAHLTCTHSACNP
jgi:hypothetical protein